MGTIVRPTPAIEGIIGLCAIAHCLSSVGGCESGHIDPTLKHAVINL